MGKNARDRKDFKLLKGGKRMDEEQQWTKEKECCANCKFWWKDPEHPEIPVGQCRESCPQAIGSMKPVPVMDRNILALGGKMQTQMQFNVNGYFPPTGPAIWCGRYRPRAN